MMDQHTRDPRKLARLRTYQAAVLTEAIKTSRLITIEGTQTLLSCGENMAHWVFRRLGTEGFMHEGVPTTNGRALVEAGDFK